MEMDGITIDAVRKLARKRGAVIIAHNYQTPEVQDVADLVGDSLELSMKAMQMDSDLIVFAGVDFMAEQTSVLCPDKVILHPDPESICPMAHHLSPEIVKRYKRKYPGAPFVAYVNSTAQVKSMAEYVVTSANALEVISRVEGDVVLFGPDSNLASYVDENVYKKVIGIPEYGCCPVHMMITPYHMKKAKIKHPDAGVLVHPECTPEVRELADMIGSTGQMLKGVEGWDEVLIGTEVDMSYRTFRRYPDKRVYPVTDGAVCWDMKKITLGRIAWSLHENRSVVRVDEKISERIRSALERTFELMEVELPWKR